MASGDLGLDIEEDAELPVIARIGAAVTHKEIVGEWAKYYIAEGFEVRVEQVGDGVMEGVAW